MNCDLKTMEAQTLADLINGLLRASPGAGGIALLADGGDTFYAWPLREQADLILTVRSEFSGLEPLAMVDVIAQPLSEFLRDVEDRYAGWLIGADGLGLREHDGWVGHSEEEMDE